MSWAVLCALSTALTSAVPTPRAVAFHYGEAPPFEALSAFDWVVLDPSVLTPATKSRLSPARPLAYVALGEVHGSAPWSEDVDSTWVLGRNEAWGGRILDLAHPDWQTYLLDQVFPKLWEDGFRGFFLDALDAHVSVFPAGPERERRWEGLVEVVRALRERYPQAVVVVNRAFERLDPLSDWVDAVAAESLIAGWDLGSESYREVSRDDRRWLEAQLQRAQERKLLTIVIDYVPPRRRERAREVAAAITRMGHVPWVAPPGLDRLGVGAVEVWPREVWLLYDSSVAPLAESAAHRVLALPLEYLGLVPRYLDVRGTLPTRPYRGEVAGVVAWLEGRSFPGVAKLRSLLAASFEERVPLVLFGYLGEIVDDGLLGRLGARKKAAVDAPARVSFRAPTVGFETDARPPPLGLEPLFLEREAEVLLEFSAGNQRRQAILLAPWGGWALQPHAVAESYGGEGRWVVDPFDFLARALDLPPAPIPDVSTENGRRILLAHIDGDGAASRSELPGHPLALTVLRRWLERHPVPHTVALVEGELSSDGAYPGLSAELEAEARRIFALPHVEPASHGFSHPFVWSEFEAGRGRALPVKGGLPSLERELLGSLEYVARLAGRPPVLFAWTGDARPGPETVDLLAAAGVANLNGGFTVASSARPSLTFIGPLGRPVGGRFQVYAPISNENDFTHRWTGPYWGFRNARETFDRTGHPRRLTPLDIYFHSYSGTKEAGLVALEEVYRDALARDPAPLHVSTWLRRVAAARRTIIAREGTDAVRLRHAEDLRTLRLPKRRSASNVKTGAGILGARETPTGSYAHLDGRPHLQLRYGPSLGPRLISASAAVAASTVTASRLELEFEGTPPHDVVVRAAGCRPGRGRVTHEGRRHRLRGSRLVCDGTSR